MNRPLFPFRSGLLSACLATVLMAGEAAAQSQQMPGRAPIADAGMSAPSQAATGDSATRSEATQASPMERLDAFSAVSRSRDGSVKTLGVPERLRAIIMSKDKASGLVRPAGEGGGTSDLTQVTPTTSYPYTTIGLLTNGCSGALIGKRYVLTAGFCVYDTQKKTWDEKIDFWPAVDGNKVPFGSVRWKSVSAPKGFVNSGDWQYNFALIELESDVGDQLGWIGFGYDNNFPFAELTLTGYPYGRGDFTMWKATCKIGEKGDAHILYSCPAKDQIKGAFGSPLYTVLKDGGISVYAIHMAPEGTGYWAHRISQSTFETLVSWMEAKSAAAASQ
jgi:V8-like Glu-specific endopeptidase